MGQTSGLTPRSRHSTRLVDLQRRRHILLTMLTTLAIRYPPGREPELVRLLRGWLDGWPGVGRIVLGMTRQGYDVQLTQYAQEGWRGEFFPAGGVHSGTHAVGSAWEPTPARAVQAAAWATPVQAEGEAGGVRRPQSGQRAPPFPSDQTTRVTE